MTPHNIGSWIGRIRVDRVCDQCSMTFRPRTPNQLRCSRQCSRLASLAASAKSHAGHVRGGIQLDGPLRDQAGD